MRAPRANPMRVSGLMYDTDLSGLLKPGQNSPSTLNHSGILPIISDALNKRRLLAKQELP